MLDLSGLLAQWGYLAIAVLVILGNVGLPVPEETVLVLSGYLAWTGELSLTVVILVAVAGAIGGDNIGYRIGRRHGRALLHRRGWLVGATPARLAAMERFVARYGAAAVFVARFLPGLRFLAGPLAGVTNLPFPRFFAANALGVLVFVPIMVGLGYGVGHAAGAYVEQWRETARQVGLVALAGLLVVTIVLIWQRRPSPPVDDPS